MKFLRNAYTWMTDSNVKVFILQFIMVAGYFFGAITPYLIYVTNSKYFGDADNNYDWMCLLSIGLGVSWLVFVAAMIAYNSLKKK